MTNLEKILKYIEDQGLANSVFERKAGISNGYVANMVKSASEVTPRMWARIKKAIPEIEKIENTPPEKSHPHKGKEITDQPMLDVQPGGFVTQEEWDNAPNIGQQETMGTTLSKVYSPVGLGSLYVLGAIYSTPISAADMEKILENYQATAKLVYLSVKSIYEMDTGAVSWTKQPEGEKKVNKKREKQEV